MSNLGMAIYLLYYIHLFLWHLKNLNKYCSPPEMPLHLATTAFPPSYTLLQYPTCAPLNTYSARSSKPFYPCFFFKKKRKVSNNNSNNIIIETRLRSFQMLGVIDQRLATGNAKCYHRHGIRHSKVHTRSNSSSDNHG